LKQDLEHTATQPAVMPYVSRIGRR